jgi:transposase-like protein
MGAVGFAKRPDDGRRGYLMAGHGSKVGRKQEEAIAALLSQRNVEEAARLAGVGVRTLYRWMKEPAFDTAYREAKRAAFSQAIARLHQMSSAAVTTLGKALLDPNTPPATKVRAAHSILDHTAKAIELEDLEARLAALERSTEARKD